MSSLDLRKHDAALAAARNALDQQRERFRAELREAKKNEKDGIVSVNVASDKDLQARVVEDRVYRYSSADVIAGIEVPVFILSTMISTVLLETLGGRRGKTPLKGPLRFLEQWAVERSENTRKLVGLGIGVAAAGTTHMIISRPDSHISRRALLTAMMSPLDSFGAPIRAAYENVYPTSPLLPMLERGTKDGLALTARALTGEASSPLNPASVLIYGATQRTATEMAASEHENEASAKVLAGRAAKIRAARWPQAEAILEQEKQLIKGSKKMARESAAPASAAATSAAAASLVLGSPLPPLESEGAGFTQDTTGGDGGFSLESDVSGSSSSPTSAPVGKAASPTEAKRKRRENFDDASTATAATATTAWDPYAVLFNNNAGGDGGGPGGKAAKSNNDYASFAREEDGDGMSSHAAFFGPGGQAVPSYQQRRLTREALRNRTERENKITRDEWKRRRQQQQGAGSSNDSR